MVWKSALALLLLPLLLAGCGDGTAEAPRLDLGRFSFDPPLPTDLRAVLLTGGEEGHAFPIERGTSGYEVPGAPDGLYRVEGPQGWWTVSLDGRPLELRRGAPPAKTMLGRSRSVYVGAMAPTVRPSLAWGATRILPDGRREPVPVEVLADDAGYVVCLRFAPAEWRGEIDLIGRVALGPPGGAAPVGPASPLCEPIRFTAPENGRPFAASMRQAGSEPLDVVLVAAAPTVDVEGTPVHVTVEDVPLEVSLSATCRRGAARFRGVPALDRDLDLRVGDDPRVLRLRPDRRRTHATTRLLAFGDLPRRRVRVPLPEGAVVDEVQVRPSLAVAFGLVVPEREEGAVAFPAPPGPFRALLRSGSSWAEVVGDGEGDVDLPPPAFEAGAVVSGSVRGAGPDTVVRLFRERGEEAVLGDGLELRVLMGGAFEGTVPAGTYLVEVAGSGGERRRPAPLVLDPGSRVHLPLDAP